MTLFGKDCEFEAKAFQDIVSRAFNDIDFPYYHDYLPLQSDKSSIFAEKYNDWMKVIVESKYYPFAQRYEFYGLSNLWQGYEGVSKPNFRPQLLEKIFGKPIPDHQ